MFDENFQFSLRSAHPTTGAPAISPAEQWREPRRSWRRDLKFATFLGFPPILAHLSVFIKTCFFRYWNYEKERERRRERERQRDHTRRIISEDELDASVTARARTRRTACLN